MSRRLKGVSRCVVSVLLVSGLNTSGCIGYRRQIVCAPKGGKPLTLPMPYLGDAEVPVTTPYELESAEWSAYRQGFVTGWKIVQNVGAGAMAVPPPDIAPDSQLEAAWRSGVDEGAAAALKVYEAWRRSNIH